MRAGSATAGSTAFRDPILTLTQPSLRLLELGLSRKQAATHVVQRSAHLILELFARFSHLSHIVSRTERQTRAALWLQAAAAMSDEFAVILPSHH